MKVAIVCDWLTNIGGAEKVLLEVHRLFPEAPIYTSQYDSKGIDWFKDADVRTGWMQILPAGWRRVLGPLRQRFFARLDLSEYDLVISVTGAEAKAVKVPNGVHISYCHVPTQYYWQLYDDYVRNPGFGWLNPLVRVGFKLLVGPLRKADFAAAQKVDFFVTISNYAKKQIREYYKREAMVINPPVEVNDFAIKLLKKQINKKSREKLPVEKPVENFYVVTSRQVTWKRIDLAIKACLELGRQLIIIGEGPEHQALVKLAKGSSLIRFLPLMDKKRLKEYLATARGYLFPSLEPFGIAPVEALAAGCPVIAFGDGGALDYVEDGKNGVLFKEQTVDSLVDGILRFEKTKFNRVAIAKEAERFAVARFDKQLREFINEKTR